VHIQGILLVMSWVLYAIFTVFIAIDSDGCFCYILLFNVLNIFFLMS